MQTSEASTVRPQLLHRTIDEKASRGLRWWRASPFISIANFLLAELRRGRGADENACTAASDS